MDHLHRELAPIGDDAWAQIDEEATRSLKQYLAGRPLVDFSGPKGWAHAGEPLGKTTQAKAPHAGVDARLRVVQPMAELRTPFSLERAELERISRGAPDPDLDPVTDAAKKSALAEDQAVFHGSQALGILGIAGASPYDPVTIPEDYNHYPSAVAQAVATLKRAGIAGPYAIALGERCYTGVIETTEHGGYPLLEHVRLILDGPVVWAPGVDGAVVVSQRGGDYEFISGQDFSIGYSSSTAEKVDLYLEESFTLIVAEPRAGIALRYAD